MSRLVACVVAFVVVGCWASRPPTSSLEVVTEAPADAVRVGPKLGTWFGEGDCSSPPQEIVLKAQKWGATWLVVQPDEIKSVWTGKRAATMCRAVAMAPR